MDFRILKHRTSEDATVYSVALTTEFSTHYFAVSFYKTHCHPVRDRWGLIYDYVLSIWHSDPSGIPDFSGTLFSGPTNHPTEHEVRTVLKNYTKNFLLEKI